MGCDDHTGIAFWADMEAQRQGEERDNQTANDYEGAVAAVRRCLLDHFGEHECLPIAIATSPSFSGYSAAVNRDAVSRLLFDGDVLLNARRELQLP